MRWGARGVALLTMMLLWTSVAHAVTPEYFTFPAGYSASGIGATADGAGNIWFGAQAPANGGPQPVASLARLTPAQATAGTSDGIAFYPTPDPPMPSCCATRVLSVAYSAVDDRVYYVRNEGTIGYAKPALVAAGTTAGFTYFHLPGGQALWDIAPKPGGGAWFTEFGTRNDPPFYGAGGRIASYDGVGIVEGPNTALQNGNTVFDSSRYDAKPGGIAVDATGKPWFTEQDAGGPGYRIATYGGGSSYEEYKAEPCAPSGPCSGSNTGLGLIDVTVAQDGSVWFTNEIKRTLGRFDPGSHQVTQFTLASIDPTLSNAKPRIITTAPDGTLWMTVSDLNFSGGPGNAVVKIVPSATPTASVFSLGADIAPYGIGADNAGNVWFTTSTPGTKVGRLAGVVGAATPIGGGGTPTPAPAPTPAGPPAVTLRPATTATATITPPQVGSDRITTNQICVGPPQDKCALIFLIREHEYVVGFPNSKAHGTAKKKKPKPRVLGTKTVTLSGGQSAKVTVKLNELGKRILKKNKKLKVDFVVTQKLAGGKTKTISKKTLTFKQKPAKRKK